MIIKEEQINGIRYAIWQLTESIETLQNLIDKRFAVSLEGINNPTRQKERLASRLLVAHLCGGFQEIAYQADGTPYLQSQQAHISISHTKGFVAVAIAPFKIGIDIEYNSARVERIAPKFLNAAELSGIHQNQDAIKYMLLHWCAKEAMYKKLTTNEPDFTQFTCHIQENKLTVVYQDITHTFYYEQNDSYSFVVG